MSRRNRRINWLPVALGAAVGAAYAGWLRPRLLSWGAAPDEIGARLPGDEMITQPALSVTRAITINAPAEAVWPFIAQIGRNGTGWYALDMLDWSGTGRAPSYTVPRRDLPAPQPGMTLDRGFTLAQVDPPRTLVFTGALPTDLIAESWASFAYVLTPHANATRLVARIRAATDGLIGQTQLAFAFEPLNFLWTVQQLNAIKRHAEAFAARGPAHKGA